jgi:hypothetical protein
MNGVPSMLCIQWQEITRSPFTCDVLESVRQKYGQEYIEALATDALRFNDLYPNDFPVTAMLSKREAVVVMVKRKNTCYIGMLSDFLPLLHPDAAAEISKRFEEFQHSAETGYGCVRLCLRPGRRRDADKSICPHGADHPDCDQGAGPNRVGNAWPQLRTTLFATKAHRARCVQTRTQSCRPPRL